MSKREYDVRIQVARKNPLVITKTRRKYKKGVPVFLPWGKTTKRQIEEAETNGDLVVDWYPSRDEVLNRDKRQSASKSEKAEESKDDGPKKSVSSSSRGKKK